MFVPWAGRADVAAGKLPGPPPPRLPEIIAAIRLAVAPSRYLRRSPLDGAFNRAFNRAFNGRYLGRFLAEIDFDRHAFFHCARHIAKALTGI